MLRSEIGLLTTFATINKREDLNKIWGWGGGKKIEKIISNPPLVLRTREYIDIVKKLFHLGSGRYHNRRGNGGGNYICS